MIWVIFKDNMYQKMVKKFETSNIKTFAHRKLQNIKNIVMRKSAFKVKVYKS